ncbi:MAG TPA: diaminopimelate epimerase [Actinobacteria bacterium]|nr:diaminopimelate epimerase [Actinomycetota bacterium]
MDFTKMNGLGNDFVMIDDRDEALDFAPEAVAWFCDRHFGVGADGLILVRRSTTPDAEWYMHYYNADGSLAEMCGNGARCFAKYLVDHGLIPRDASALTIETLGGLKPVTFTRDDDGMLETATVDMGEPLFSPEEIPAAFEGTQVYDCPVETPYGTVHVTGVNMGNPHAVIWVDDVETAPVDTVGPYLERHERFPNGTNVEFAQLIDNETVRMRVWERGVGETLACGTGACAVAVAATLSCRTGRDSTVQLPGGDLLIRWHENDHVYMTGSAAVSFTGTVELPEEE